MGDKLVYSQMTYYQRAKLKELLDAGLSKECIAEKAVMWTEYRKTSRKH